MTQQRMHRFSVGLFGPIVAHIACLGLLSQSRCEVFAKNQQVEPSLATLTAQVTSVRPRRGQPIPVTLILRAGQNGVYLPNGFEDFMKTCEYGFSAELLTRTGKTASSDPMGCAASKAYSPDETAQNQLKQFVRLAPGETRIWQTVLPTQHVKEQNLCLYAEYLSFHYMIDAVAQLPEVGGTVAKGRITAVPIALHLSR